MRKQKSNEKQRLATLKRVKRRDDNELERNLRLEKVVASVGVLTPHSDPPTV